MSTLMNNSTGNSNIVSLCSTLFIRLIVGPLVDRYGPRKVMAGILIVGAIPSGLAGTVSTAEGLYTIRFFIGASLTHSQAKYLCRSLSRYPRRYLCPLPGMDFSVFRQARGWASECPRWRVGQQWGRVYIHHHARRLRQSPARRPLEACCLARYVHLFLSLGTLLPPHAPSLRRLHVSGEVW